MGASSTKTADFHAAGMFSFSTVHLIAWAFLICNVTTAPDNKGRELTQFKVKLYVDSPEKFPRVLPVVLQSPHQAIIFNFIKRDTDYNIPIYVQSKDERVAFLDTPPVKNAAFYTDERYDASVTLYCEENDPLSASSDTCKEELMSGFFNLDGTRHVIEPTKRIVKRFIIHLPGDLSKAFTKRHQVFKIHERNYFCGQNDERGQFSPQKRGIPQNIVDKDAHRRSNRNRWLKQVNTIEIMAVFTHILPPNDELIKKDKLYYMHVFWGVKELFKNNPMADVILNIKLTAFAVEPDTTPLNVFVKKGGNVLDGMKMLGKLTEFKKNHPCDHVTMFTKHSISHTKTGGGLTPDDSMCSNKSVSIISNSGDFNEIFVLAHELGHSLGADHDGVYNNCKNDTGFIMDENSIDNRNMTTVNALNSYKFSKCSLDAIRKFINSMKENCLLFTGKTEKTAYPAIPTGQLYSVQDQCQSDPKFTSVCPIGRKPQTFCLLLFCSTRNSTCETIVPAYKTTCQNKKWCIFGHCVFDSKAPVADEKCLYGDSHNLTSEYKFPNGTILIPRNCPEFLRYVPDICSLQSKRRLQCCDTCFKLANPHIFPRKQFFPFLPSPDDNRDAAINLRSHLFPVALAVLHFCQQMENYFAS